MLRLVLRRLSIPLICWAALPASFLATCGWAESAPAAAPAPLPSRPGAAVPGFGNGGKLQLTPPAGKPTFRERLAVDAQGRVLLLTVTKESGSFLTRLLPDGAADPEFAAGGWVAAPEGEWSEMALDAVGRILLAGAVKGDLAVARLMPDGAPDPTFGTDGVARLHVGRPAVEGFPDESFTRLVPLPDGSVIAAGSTLLCSATCNSAGGVLVKFMPDGEPDASFGASGIDMLASAPRPDPGDDKGVMRRIFALAVQPDGKILVGGDDFRLLVVTRLTTSGATDPSFGENGTFFTVRETEGEEDEGELFHPGVARALLVEPSGRIVVVGDRLIYGLRPDGRLDPRFGYPGSGGNFRGISTVAPQGGNGVVSSADALLDRAGRIVVVGNILGAGIARFLPDGRSDPRFGGGGLMSLRVGNSPPPPETEYSEPLASVVQLPGGELVTAGYGYFNRRDPRPAAVVLSRNDRPGRFAHCAGSLATYQGTPRSDGLGWFFGTIVTFAGNDRIAGAGGAVCTGPGDDVVRNRLNWSEPIYLGPGDDRSIGSTGRIFGGPGNDRIVLGDETGGPLVANGGPGEDTLVGTDEPDRLEGGPGDDVLIAGAGRALLVGGPGDDVLIGGKGDVFRPGPGRNRIVIRR